MNTVWHAYIIHIRQTHAFSRNKEWTSGIAQLVSQANQWDHRHHELLFPDISHDTTWYLALQTHVHELVRFVVIFTIIFPNGLEMTMLSTQQQVASCTTKPDTSVDVC